VRIPGIRTNALSDDARPGPTVASSSVDEHRIVGAPVQRVRKAYEQVHDQLRDLIMKGELARGQRLPNEAALAREFGVSRGTVREALRVLAAQNLIRTAKGAGGGSFVTLPTVDHISEFLKANISLLSESQDVSPEELLEARDLLEGWAARAAAERRTEAHVVRLRDCIIDEEVKLGTEEQFTYNAAFHTGVLDAAQNTLLAIAAQPVFGVLQTNMRRSEITRETLHQINDDHRAIVDAIDAGDADQAERQMRSHVDFLRATYVRVWTHHGHRAATPGD
jgi:GntR family transcriptional regulator, transcriptional repressor for pyruvate dehydrogenase complex